MSSNCPESATVEGQGPGINLARQIDTLRSVDDQVKAMYDAVKQSGRLDRTLFVYVSDNGYMHGEHRLDGKGYPYLKSTNVPLVVRWGARSFRHRGRSSDDRERRHPRDDPAGCRIAEHQCRHLDDR
ncbi:MAG: sulfatase-like hydrolase/transferase [Actinobacteria bacterium]|nr:sulfatase-like hydrolase/transferase [Actinomycetota bacterium]